MAAQLGPVPRQGERKVQKQEREIVVHGRYRLPVSQQIIVRDRGAEINPSSHDWHSFHGGVTDCLPAAGGIK
jgi:hypothetical protein